MNHPFFLLALHLLITFLHHLNLLVISRRMIGPAMPSTELLAAAAKLTEAQAELRCLSFSFF